MKLPLISPAIFGMCAALSLAAPVATAPALAASKQSKSAVKAAIVYNIIRFARFPKAKRQLDLCVLDKDPIANKLLALDGRSAGGSYIHVVPVSSTRSMGSNCDIIYLDRYTPESVGGAGPGQLLIGAGPAFAERGGTIGLIQFGGQVRFVINESTARSSRIRFPAQLMQLAAKVIS